MISDLPNSSTTSKKKRDSAQKESEFKLAVEYVDEQLPCAHKKCTNPDGTVDWLDCTGCEEWFHDICVGIDPKIVNDAFKYYCSSCETKRVNKSKKLQESEKPKKSSTKDSADSKMTNCFKLFQHYGTAKPKPKLRGALLSNEIPITTPTKYQPRPRKPVLGHTS